LPQSWQFAASTAKIVAQCKQEKKLEKEKKIQVAMVESHLHDGRPTLIDLA